MKFMSASELKPYIEVIKSDHIHFICDVTKNTFDICMAASWKFCFLQFHSLINKSKYG